MDMSYKEKYFKYKIKYNQLKLNITGSGQQELHLKLLNNDNGIGLYALAAPNDCASSTMKIRHYNNIKKVADGCNPDGLIVYDIQDEPCRDGKPRPFKFVKKERADLFANFIVKQFPNNPVILYRAFPESYTKQNVTENDLQDEQTPEQIEKIIEEKRRKIIDEWMEDTITKKNMKTLVWIGGNSRRLPKINDKIPSDYIGEQIKEKYKDVISGSVCLPERGDIELELMITRTQKDCKFFITQIVYNYKLYENLINKYIDECIKLNIVPSRIIFNFALFGEQKSIEFMKCLGVIFSDEITQEITQEIDITKQKTHIDKSYELCIKIFSDLLTMRKTILSTKKKYIPMGFSVDVVTGNKLEYEKSINLYNDLKKIMQLNYN